MQLPLPIYKEIEDRTENGIVVYTVNIEFLDKFYRSEKKPYMRKHIAHKIEFNGVVIKDVLNFNKEIL